MAIQVMDTEAWQKYSSTEAQPIMLHQSDGLVILLLCLEPGQRVGPCELSMRVVYSVLAGSGQLRVEAEQAELKTGAVIIVPAGITRTLAANERMCVMAVQVP
jgi:quercetin dioxygenase-like cupin family protein